MLTRRIGESVVIDIGGKLVTVSVADIDRNKCRLAFQAAKEIGIYRSELLATVEGEVQVMRVHKEGKP